MTTVLEMSAGQAFQLQRSRKSKPYNRLSNSGPGLPYAMLHLVLDSEECALTDSCATLFTCSHTKSRLTNPSVQIPLMHGIISQTSCCSLWMTVNSMLATYRSQMKRTFTSMALSASKTREFGEAEILILLNLHPCIHQN